MLLISQFPHTHLVLSFLIFDSYDLAYLVFYVCHSVEERWDRGANGVEDVVRNMKAVERAVLGFKCKQIIDIGRMMWVKEREFDAQLVKYVPSSISPENHLLVAKKAKCL